MTRRPALISLLAGALLASVLVGASGTASARRAPCGADLARNGGYTYAGHQADGRSDGVRATITTLRPPEVVAGHVAGWVGVGGPGQGPNGEDEWIQAGIASVPGGPAYLYAEVTRAGTAPAFHLLEDALTVGQTRRVAVLEMAHHRGWWRVWVNGKAMTKPVYLRGSSDRWEPIATAESWNGGQVACNRFAFEFDHVSVSHGPGGNWHAFVPGYRFLDGNYKLRALRTSSAATLERSQRDLSGEGPLPYAFVASSS